MQMKRAFPILVFVFGCSDEPQPFGVECSQSLPAADYGGAPWPSYDVANASFADCSQLEPPFLWRRGACSDGKRFLAKSGESAGDILYFEGATMVGKTESSNATLCQGGYRYGDTLCEETDLEEVTCP
jgi:hypothetical protein